MLEPRDRTPCDDAAYNLTVNRRYAAYHMEPIRAHAQGSIHHREVAKTALAGFVVGKTLAANQIEFVNLIVNHLTEHGVVEPRRLYESPFTDLTPYGPEGLFGRSGVDELIGVLAEVRRTAIAA